jgi:hypothetical protein
MATIVAIPRTRTSGVIGWRSGRARASVSIAVRTWLDHQRQQQAHQVNAADGEENRGKAHEHDQGTAILASEEGESGRDRVERDAL